MTTNPDETKQTTQQSDHEQFMTILSARQLTIEQFPEDTDDTAVFEFDPENSPLTVFPQSVASGSPTPSGVILWTRINPEAYNPEQPVALEIATDEGFETIVYRGVCGVDPESMVGRDYTLKIDLDGKLDPATTYVYRFIHNQTRSRVGRCRTLPASDASPDRLRFAVLCCQDYLNGYYGAYHHIAREDIDYILHVGYIIYESAMGDFKGAGSEQYTERHITHPSGEDRPRSIEDYRNIYRTYRSDRFFQEALEQHSIIARWDDHEFIKDIFWDTATGAPSGDHPQSDNPAFMRELVADALQAWWDYTPTRVEYDPTADTFHERFQLWRTFEFGDLITLVLTDERLYRTKPHGHDHIPLRRVMRPETGSLEQTMLGDAQREWFLNEMSSGEQTWTVWADTVLTLPFMVGAGPLTVYPVNTGWDGYHRERQRIFQTLAETDHTNFITLTGDMHCVLAGYQQTEYDDSLERLLSRSTPSNRVGVEFMTPPITSINFAEAGNVDRGWRRALTEPILSRGTRWQNPHLKLFDSHHWGYSIVEWTSDACTYTVYAIDKTVDSAHATKELLAKLRVPEGCIEIENITP
jgi:alkaline phosphatase D